MKPKPRNQAVTMVHMLARHLHNLQPLFKLVLAHRALVLLRVEELIVDGDSGEILDGVFGCRRRAVAVWIVVGELLNQLLEAGAEEVVAHVHRKPKPRLGTATEVELDIGTVGAKVLKMVLEED